MGVNSHMSSQCSLCSEGRGTATLEGLAVAQATMEHVHDVLGMSCGPLYHSFPHFLPPSPRLQDSPCHSLP